MKKIKISSSRLYIAATSLLLFIALVPFQNCGKLTLADLKKDDNALVTTTDDQDPGGNPGGGNTSGSTGGANPGGDSPGMSYGKSYDLSISSQEGHVCSPFGSTPGASSKSGIKSELRYINPQSPLNHDQRVAKLSTDYFQPGDSNFVKVPETIYLADVNIPNRHFAYGFSLSDGTLLKDNSGNILVEFFALRMETILKLSDTDAEGYYLLSTISDDGTVVQVQINGEWKTIISNDTAHSARMGCMATSDKILMTRETRLPVRIYYNQGPATEIANVLLWNYRGPADGSNPPGIYTINKIHEHCGDADSNNYWRASDSQIGSWGLDVLQAEWKILKPENFLLPNDEINPCSFSNYELDPHLEVRDQVTRALELVISESAVIHMKIYRIKADSSRELVQSIDETASSLRKSLSLENVDVLSKYQIEVIMEIPSKHVQVLKIFNLSFVERGSM